MWKTTKSKSSLQLNRPRRSFTTTVRLRQFFCDRRVIAPRPSIFGHRSDTTEHSKIITHNHKPQKSTLKRASRSLQLLCLQAITWHGLGRRWA